MHGSLRWLNDPPLVLGLVTDSVHRSRDSVTKASDSELSFGALKINHLPRAGGIC